MSYFPKPTPPPLQVVRDTPKRQPAEGLHPYAAAIVESWTDRLLKLKTKPWQKGDAWDDNCFWTARKLTELANSSWSGYTHDQARSDYFDNAPHDSVWDEREKCWLQGSGKASGQSLPPPPPGATYEIPEVTILDDVRGAAEFWAERPILQHIYQFSRARRVSPWAVLGYTLARVVTATPRGVALPPIIGGYASLNLFVGIVGPSGAGKGAAFAVAKEAINVGDIITLNPGSGEGIIHAYVKRTKDGLDQHTEAVLFNVPEIDTLTAVGARQGSTVMPILRSGWSGEQIGTHTADASRRVNVPDHHYRMCLVAGIQPGRAGAILDDAEGGTPQRFLWLPATDPTISDHAPAAPQPLAVDTNIRVNADIIVNGQGLAAMKVCEKAKSTIIKADIDRKRGKGDALDGHALLTRLKVAAALAVLDERREVTEDDWRLSRVITRVSDATRASVVAHRQASIAKANEARGRADGERLSITQEVVADAAIKRVAKGIVRHLAGSEMVWNLLRKKFSAADKAHFEAAVERLEQAGQIEVKEEANRRVVRAL